MCVSLRFLSQFPLPAPDAISFGFNLASEVVLVAAHTAILVLDALRRSGLALFQRRLTLACTGARARPSNPRDV